MSDQTVKLPPSALPELQERRDRAVRHVTATAPVIVCRHLAAHVATGGTAVICAEHPGAGLLCPPCSVEHTARHTYDTEHRCDRCGTVAPALHSLMGEHPLTVFTTTTTGAAGLYVGPALVVALGICPPCGTTAGIPAVEVDG